MFRIIIIMGVITLTAIGCARDNAQRWRTPADHPANARAASAAMPKRGATLTVTETAEAPSPIPMDHGSHGTMPSDADPPPAKPSAHDHGASGPRPEAPPDAHSGHAVPAATTGSSMPSSEAARVYACPMHPEVTSSDADARCPKCGMKLVSARRSEVKP